MKNSRMLARRPFLGVLALAPFGGCSTQNGARLTVACGRLARAALRFPTGYFATAIQAPRGETVEDVLVDLKRNGTWDALAYEEKREIVFIALIYCNVEGGEMVALLQMLGSDSRRISSDIEAVSDGALHDKWGWDSERVVQFRQQLQFLRGNPDK